MDARTFVIEKEEQFVLADRATQVSAELVPAQRRLSQPRFVRKKIVRVENVIPEEFESLSVERVGTGFRGDIDDAARRAAIFGREGVAVDLHLRDRSNAGSSDQRGAGPAGLIG